MQVDAGFGELRRQSDPESLNAPVDRLTAAPLECTPLLCYTFHQAGTSTEESLARLSMAFLGPCDVRLDGQPHNFKYRKALALLVYLAVEAQRPHGRNHLSELLWPDQPEREAHKALRDSLHDLRRALGDVSADLPFLLLAGDTIRFNLASCYWLDVSEFRGRLAGYERGAACSATDAGSPQHVEALEGAVGLYGGSFLSDMPVVHSEPFEQWALLERERLHLKAVWACRQLAAAYTLRGDYEGAQAPVRRQLELEPWNEG
jgi:DNA-binding SARP family transcriptional activator